MSKIVFLDTETVGPDLSFTALEQLGTLVRYDSTPPEKIVERLTDADIAIVNKSRITAEIMQACNRLKLICIAATGMNNIDLDFAAKSGIAVKNAAAYSTDSVVQLTYSILLSLITRISDFNSFVKSGEYSKSHLFTSYRYMFSELANKQVGIIGMGAIGRKSATVASAFGSTVVYYSTSGQNLEQPYPRLELDELLETSDVVIIHAPLNEKTFNLIDIHKLRLMKPTAVLVNTGRGSIVNEADLAAAVDSGIIAGAALDVFAEEPLAENNPLLGVKHPERLILTPHVAWTSVEARVRLLQKIAENIQTFINDIK